jgi:hypothetical protein
MSKAKKEANAPAVTGLAQQLRDDPVFAGAHDDEVIPSSNPNDPNGPGSLHKLGDRYVSWEKLMST